jgi:hypothetical protein
MLCVEQAVEVLMSSGAGTQFTCFTGTKVQILTQAGGARSVGGALATANGVDRDAHDWVCAGPGLH